MTRPRCLVENWTYIVTRRTIEGRALFTPDEEREVGKTFRFYLAHYATLHGIRIHGYCLMSNRYHLLLSENESSPKIPKFMRDLNLALTKAINVLLERQGPAWDPRRYSSVLLTDRETFLAQLVYVILNPVQAGLVETPSQWPGPISLPEEIAGGVVGGFRPPWLKPEKTLLPEIAQLKLTLPPCCEEEDPELFRNDLEERMATRLKILNEKHAEQGVVGAQAVLEQDPFETPSTETHMKHSDPVVACVDPGMRETLLGYFRDFYKLYSKAWREWNQGNRSVEFPRGSYAMRELHKAQCPVVIPGFT